MRMRHRYTLWYLPASTPVVKLHAFLQSALGAVDESWSLLEGQHELRPPLTHKWHCQTVTAGVESINLWAAQASLILS